MAIILAREIKKAAKEMVFKMLIQTVVGVGISICVLYLLTIAQTVAAFIGSENWNFFIAGTTCNLDNLSSLNIEEPYFCYDRGRKDAEVGAWGAGQYGEINAEECIFYFGDSRDLISFFRDSGAFFGINELQKAEQKSVMISQDLAEYAGVNLGEKIKVEVFGVEETFVLTGTFVKKNDDLQIILPCVAGWMQTKGTAQIGTCDLKSYFSIIKNLRENDIEYQDLTGILSVKERTNTIMIIIASVLFVLVFVALVIQVRQNNQLLQDRQKHIDVLYACGYSVKRISFLYTLIFVLVHSLTVLLSIPLFSIGTFYINHALEDFFTISQTFWQRLLAVLSFSIFLFVVDVLMGLNFHKKIKRQYV